MARRLPRWLRMFLVTPIGFPAVGIPARAAEPSEELPAAWLLSSRTDLTMSGLTLVTKDCVDPLIHGGSFHELADAYPPGDMNRKDPHVSALDADRKG